MAAVWITRDGDSADQIALETLGATAGETERLLEANPGLAERGPLLPPGLRVTIPDAPSPAQRAPLRLWD